MFINVSNQLSCNWSQEQLEAAKQYGEIKDITFPAVDPSWTKDDVSLLAFEIANDISRIADPHGTTILVEGEPTLAFAIVSFLHQCGHTCVTATRICIKHPSPIISGRNYIMKFVQFREYM